MVKKIKIIVVLILVVSASMLLVGCVQDRGDFYSLQEAYNNGWLTKEDLQTIANHHTNPEQGPKLSEKTERAIKETRAYDLRYGVETGGNIKEPSATVKDVIVTGYYGEYNGLFAVMITDAYTYTNDAIRDIDIAGVTFHYTDGNRILVWKSK